MSRASDFNVWYDQAYGRRSPNFLFYSHLLTLENVRLGPAVVFIPDRFDDLSLSAGPSVELDTGNWVSPYIRALAGTTSVVRENNPTLTMTSIGGAYLFPLGDDKPFFNPEFYLTRVGGKNYWGIGNYIYVPVGWVTPFAGAYYAFTDYSTNKLYAVLGLNITWE